MCNSPGQASPQTGTGHTILIELDLHIITSWNSGESEIECKWPLQALGHVSTEGSSSNEQTKMRWQRALYAAPVATSSRPAVSARTFNEPLSQTHKECPTKSQHPDALAEATTFPPFSPYTVMGVLRLAIDGAGIYGAFLLWAVIQERLGTTPYTDPQDPSQSRYFRSVLFLNTVQSLTSALSALLYALATQRHHATEPLPQTLGLEDPTKESKSPALPSPASKNGRAQRQQQHFPSQISLLERLTGNDKRMLSKMLQCALLHSIGSPFAFVSLRHIDYPTMILAKSCKLVPVMLMNIILYRRRFASHKYMVVLMVTLGISVFTLANPNLSSKKSKGAASNSLTGLGLLLISLMIDGATNSTQDEIFVRFKTTGVQMMFWMNLFATLLTATACVLPIPSIPLIGYHNPAGSATTELSNALSFISSHPSVLHDILAFSLAGALGQLFIFDTLQHFGSLTLVTITVTRKLFTMLLSVFIYQHDLAMVQWVGVAIVFAAIALEAQHKRSGGLSKKTVKEEEPARVKNI